MAHFKAIKALFLFPHKLNKVMTLHFCEQSHINATKRYFEYLLYTVSDLEYKIFFIALSYSSVHKPIFLSDLYPVLVEKHKIAG